MFDLLSTFKHLSLPRATVLSLCHTPPSAASFLCSSPAQSATTKIASASNWSDHITPVNPFRLPEASASGSSSLLVFSQPQGYLHPAVVPAPSFKQERGPRTLPLTALGVFFHAADQAFLLPQLLLTSVSCLSATSGHIASSAVSWHSYRDLFCSCLRKP